MRSHGARKARVVEGQHKFFEAGPLAASLPVEDVDARIVSALRYMTTQVASRADEAHLALAKDIPRELSRQIASGTLDYLAKASRFETPA